MRSGHAKHQEAKNGAKNLRASLEGPTELAVSKFENRHNLRLLILSGIDFEEL